MEEIEKKENMQWNKFSALKKMENIEKEQKKIWHR